MKGTFLTSTVIVTMAAAPTSSTPLDPPRPPMSWSTLPVFFHAANSSGPWSDAAAVQIARFPLATNEKNHAMVLPNGTKQSEEIAGPQACVQETAAATTAQKKVDTFFYLNSVISWPFNFELQNLMVQHPEWRLKNTSGGDIIQLGCWLYNLTNRDMRAAWVSTCTTAAKKGCTGCFIDQANVQEGIATWPSTSQTVLDYRAAHLAAFTELDAALAPMGGYSIYNHLGVTSYNTSSMMIEDFAASEKCIETLQTVAARGLTVEAHAGNLPKGNQCINGDTNAMAAFLIGAGNFSYYHCSLGWGCDARWPAVADSWLDWLPEYDYPLGAPVGLASKTPSPTSPTNSSLWSRTFETGTRVVFDGGSGNGTIYWSNGIVQAGPPGNLTGVARGCAWESL